MSVPFPPSAVSRSADPADLPPASEGVSEEERSCRVTRSGELAVQRIPLAWVKAAPEPGRLCPGRFLRTAHMGCYGREFAMRRAFVRRL
ncbi:hypothetical protein [Streptomyces sp. NPDC059743]|uniref:hypothetical protein n=1 Tax=Streptomyces sp. NPDC059743 TaxID=3346928 RepID=UPI003665F7F0